MAYAIQQGMLPCAADISKPHSGPDLISDGFCRRHPLPNRRELNQDLALFDVSTPLPFANGQDLLLCSKRVRNALHRGMHLFDAFSVSDTHHGPSILRSDHVRCKPIRGYWDSSVGFNCIDMRSTLMSIAGLNSLSDFLVYL
jgi:hypothetical protein